MAKRKNGTTVNIPEAQTYKLLKEFKPKTPNQASYVRAIAESDVILCTGPAGTGKTAVAVGIAVEQLINGKVNKLAISRPVVESGRGIGYLPGTANEKLHPYLLPMLDELGVYLTPQEIHKYISQELIEICPLEYMRGRTQNNAIALLDEAQNATFEQLKMFITRIGRGSKCIINGDLRQSDLERNGKIGLQTVIEKLTDLPNVAIVELTTEDIIRNPIIAGILARLES